LFLTVSVLVGRKRWEVILLTVSEAEMTTVQEDSENAFQECFKNWQRRWDCQASQGDYFEGNAGPYCLR
jgi:hypothetical protein